MKEILTTDIKVLTKIAQGKVRDIYEVDDTKLLIVSTDRLSAYDSVLPSGIPGRGKILTGMSVFWFDYFKELINNHIVGYRVSDLPRALQEYSETLEGRFMLVDKADRIDVECIIRGYLAGSGWRDYKTTGRINDIQLAAGLEESAKLTVPIFTPTTKADSGHDQPVTFEELQAEIGADLADKLKDFSLAIFKKASEYAEQQGIIIADTKFEFGIIDGKLSLIDEILSPDSSRFWSKDAWAPGTHQKAFDKQFVRDYLANVGWTGEGEPPSLPDDIIEDTVKRYSEVYNRIVPADFDFKPELD